MLLNIVVYNIEMNLNIYNKCFKDNLYELNRYETSTKCNIEDVEVFQTKGLTETPQNTEKHGKFFM